MHSYPYKLIALCVLLHYIMTLFTNLNEVCCDDVNDYPHLKGLVFLMIVFKKKK